MRAVRLPIYRSVALDRESAARTRPGQLVICRNPERAVTIATPVLGAAVAVALRDQHSGKCGVLAFLLPDSSLDPQRAAQQPELFADTGIEILVSQLVQLLDEPPQLHCWVVGGADPLLRTRQSSQLHLGRRNVEAANQHLAAASITNVVRCIGGQAARQLAIKMPTGAVRILEVPAPVPDPVPDPFLAPAPAPVPAPGPSA